MRGFIMRHLSVLLGSVALVCALSAQAQTPHATRIGFVNAERLFSEAQAAVTAQAKLQSEFAGRERKLAQEGKELAQAIAQFQKQSKQLANKQREETERKLMQRDIEFKKKRHVFQIDLNNRKNEEMQLFVTQANAVIAQVAKKEKYDIIIQEAAYINPRIDITDQVLKLLNNKK